MRRANGGPLFGRLRRVVRVVLYHVALMFAMATAGCARPAVTDKAMALTRTGQAAAAAALLTRALAENPDDVAARRLLVRVEATRGNLAAARAEVDELRRRLGPEDPTPYLELGHALELAHHFDEALAAYDEAARVAPASPVGPREAGLRAARWGEAEVAIERLDEAVRRGATDAETLHALGVARLHTRDVDGAERAYRAALARDPDAVDSIVGLATVALVRDDYAAALAAYDMLRARRPSSPVAELGRAYALAKLGRRGEASQAIDRAEALGGPPANVARLRALVR